MTSWARWRADRQARWVLALAGLGLILAWLVAPAGVPLYDGVGFPDERYRYVQPPAGYPSTPPPGPATASAPGSGGANTEAFYATSPEQGPQASVYVSAGVLRGPTSATSYSMTATPLAPVGQPPNEQVDGNAYRLSFTAGGAVATFSPTQPDAFSTVQLRATTSAQPGPQMFYRPSAQQPWRMITTNRSGMDIYQSAVQGPGDYALARPAAGYPSTGGSPTAAPAASSKPVGVLVGLGALLAVVIAGLLALRVRASRRRRP